MDIEYLVSSEDHFGREREREKERERERERVFSKAAWTFCGGG